MEISEKKIIKTNSKKLVKILIIRFSSLGDIILLSPVFRETKKVFPNAEITFMTSTEFGSVHSQNPYIDKTYLLDRKGGIVEIFVARKFIKEQNFSIVFDAHSSLRSFFICFTYKKFVNKQNRFFSVPKRSKERYMQIFLKKKPTSEIISQRKAYLAWLDSPQLGFTKEKRNENTEIFISANIKERTRMLFLSYLLNSNSLVVIAMGAKHFNKCWLAPYWNSLIEKLKEENYQVVVIGTEEDSKILAGYKRAAKNASLDLTGKLNLEETAGLLKEAQVLITGDSAPLHLAEALGTPVVALFGPTVREFGFTPFLENSVLLEKELNCRPCSAHGKKKCTHKTEKQCMCLITPQEVWETVELVLKKTFVGYQKNE